jgi:hypothetical protein
MGDRDVIDWKTRSVLVPCVATTGACASMAALFASATQSISLRIM